jgi:hypothetical protein
MSDHVKNLDDPEEMDRFLRAYRARFSEYVQEAAAPSAEC